MANTQDQTDRLPNTSFNSSYPYNQSTVYEGGHFVEFDNTPGHTRLRIGHKSGTYNEISEDGNSVDCVVNNHHEYVKGGQSVTIDKNLDHKIGGHIRTSVGNDYHLEVGANGALIIGGSGTIVVKDSLSVVATDKVTIICGSDASIAVGGNANVSIGGDAIMKVKGNYNLQAKTINMKADTTVIDSEVHLGGSGGNPAAQLGTIDTAGDSDISNLATRVFVQ